MDDDERRMRTIGDRLAEMRRVLGNKRAPIKREIDALTEKHAAMGVDANVLRELNKRNEAAHADFRAVRARASQVKADIEGIESDIENFESEFVSNTWPAL